ncbi:MAG: hypothetical protein JWQ18_3102, partial [Conexibacter sp.]|nr:hypothetical protein [Conexibacter sp.]
MSAEEPHQPPLRTCPHCGREARTRYERCPHCQESYFARTRGQRRRRALIAGEVASVLLAVIAAGAVI